MLPGYFDYILVHRKKKKKTVRLRPDLTPKFLSTYVPNPAQKARPDFDSDVRFLHVYGAIIVCTVFYQKSNSINLLNCGVLICGTVLSTLMKNLMQFCNVYQFIQGMNKAYQMSSNYVTSLDQFK